MIVSTRARAVKDFWQSINMRGGPCNPQFPVSSSDNPIDAATRIHRGLRLRRLLRIAYRTVRLRECNPTAHDIRAMGFRVFTLSPRATDT